MYHVICSILCGVLSCSRTLFVIGKLQHQGSFYTSITREVTRHHWHEVAAIKCKKSDKRNRSKWKMKKKQTRRNQMMGRGNLGYICTYTQYDIVRPLIICWQFKDSIMRNLMLKISFCDNLTTYLLFVIIDTEEKELKKYIVDLLWKKA